MRYRKTYQSNLYQRVVSIMMVHIVSSELNYLLGISPRTSGFFLFSSCLLLCYCMSNSYLRCKIQIRFELDLPLLKSSVSKVLDLGEDLLTDSINRKFASVKSLWVRSKGCIKQVSIMWIIQGVHYCRLQSWVKGK